jgi:hypothetical protein
MNPILIACFAIRSYNNVFRLAAAVARTAQRVNNTAHDGVECLPSLKSVAENLDTGDESRKRPFDKLLNKPLHHYNERRLPGADAP